MWFSPSGPYKYGYTASSVLLYPATQISATNPYRIGPGLWGDFSPHSYKRALGFEATRDAWRRISSFYSSQTGLLPNKEPFSPRTLLSPRSPSLEHTFVTPGPRAFFSTTTPSPIGPGLWGFLRTPSMGMKRAGAFRNPSSISASSFT